MCDWNKNFCQNLCYLRTAHHMTQKQMAQILGVSTATYRRIERCEPSVRLNAAMVRTVCDRFLISADGILRENWQELREEP